MAPSVTETLFALGLGPRVVGVSRYCQYPPEARQKPRVGGFLDPNFEAIVALRPDLVVVLEGNTDATSAFETLQLPTLTVDHRGLDGLLESITTFGRTFGVEKEADILLGKIQAQLNAVEKKIAQRARPRVLISVDRAPGTGRLQDVYVVGHDGHLDRVLELAGGQNAFPRRDVRFPVVSAEGILEINPEVIIDVVPEATVARLGEATLLADWNQVADVEAVRGGRVHLLTDDHATIPGPAFIELVEWLAARLHPEPDQP